MRYDRQLLLAGEKRNAVLELAEVRGYGSDSYGDPDYVRIYGLQPADWHARGMRLLGRTAVECTRDELADQIGKDVHAVAAKARRADRTLVIDLFAGSGNTLYWLLHHLPGARGLGFELDQGVFELTRKNLEILALPIDIRNIDYLSGIAGVAADKDQLLIAFVAPPWGDALKPTGLDLRRTDPPVSEIIERLLHKFSGSRLLFAVQVHETLEPSSLAELTPRFDWSALRIYGLNAPGQNHGVLLATVGWSPPRGSSSTVRTGSSA